MTDLENLRKKEYQHEQAEQARADKIIEQITHLFLQLSPTDQESVLEILSEDETDNEGPSQDDDE